MPNKFTCVVAMASAMGAMTLLAQEGTKSAEGTLMLDKKTYPLKHALAYETTIDNEPAVAVVLSGQAVSGEKLKERLFQQRQSINNPPFRQIGVARRRDFPKIKR